MQPDEAPLNLGQLEAAWLSAARFQENPSFDVGEHRAHYSLRRRPEVHVAEDLSMSLVRVLVEIEWTELPDNEAPFDLALEVSGAFAWEGEALDESYMRSWSNLNGVYLLWPYVRTYIAMLTGASRLPALTIETLAVPGLRASVDALLPPEQLELDEVDVPEEAPRESSV